jgi:hypothetical protein
VHFSFGIKVVKITPGKCVKKPTRNQIYTPVYNLQNAANHTKPCAVGKQSARHSTLTALNGTKTNAACKALYDRPWKKEALLPFATTARANICGGKVWFAVPRRLFRKTSLNVWFLHGLGKTIAYSPARFKTSNSNCSVILKFVDFILDRIGFTDGITPASLASTITPIVPIMVNPS